MYRIVFALLIMGMSFSVSAQKYIAREGYVRFFSEAPLENIEAVNNDGLSIFNFQNGEIAFTIPIMKFEFQKSLMQKHFNENYLESDKFPKATFQGVISGFEISGDEQSLTANGTMTIHGVSNEINVKGVGILREGKIILKSMFPIEIKNYDIKIPKVVLLNIAEVVDVTIEFEYSPYEN